MQFKTTITSLVLAALAPGLHAQATPLPGTPLGVITFTANHIPQESPISQGICEPRLSPPGIVTDINIAVAPSYKDVQCTIYSEATCSGDEYVLGSGAHHFEHDFVAGSFKCTV
ncbi:uncharacterized protein BDV14DRAFT_205142 [Aspergillus stella-maris]|uniref:uncharacterized protein n=1 Tax=Aspergillus stella-maris TaxID=1810926 RepID=UPI003CCCA518